MPADHRPGHHRPGHRSPGRPQAHFTAFLAGVGYHESAWRLADPADLAGPARFGVLERAARAAERGLLDAVFFADSPGLEIFRARYFPQVGFDPLEILAALSRTTSHVGLIATASTTYSAPYDLARRFSTIDHLSGGRAGWNIVTTRYAGAAGNFGLAAHPAHEDRYARAEEFVEVVSRLWESWDASAVVGEGRPLSPRRGRPDPASTWPGRPPISSSPRSRTCRPGAGSAIRSAPPLAVTAGTRAASWCCPGSTPR
jgi:alkanesulfonate monooxygenase SsuD/methylene tetrahydromethanopterin reductase-like flavin-dependent oxidoreductase (luciferase family)